MRQGSPPRVRGKAIQARKDTSPFGITPARAGKSYLQLNQTILQRDHPRACGEKISHYILAASYLGSPPRVRGKGLCGRYERLLPGITPARAGKRTGKRAARCAMRDHPRACGEKHQKRRAAHPRLGSPPRVRGKVPGAGLGRGGRGITPARAGKSSWTGSVRL